ncbi:unnamed protein product, partial [Choristocarpus tenellus]
DRWELGLVLALLHLPLLLRSKFNWLRCVDLKSLLVQLYLSCVLYSLVSSPSLPTSPVLSYFKTPEVYERYIYDTSMVSCTRCFKMFSSFHGESEEHWQYCWVILFTSLFL